MSAEERIPTVPTGYRQSVFSRVVAAVVGGYGLATTASIVLARVMPGPKVDAVLAAVLLSFAVYVGAILWAFAARTAWRAWWGLLGAAVVCAVLGRAMT